MAGANQTLTVGVADGVSSWARYLGQTKLLCFNRGFNEIGLAVFGRALGCMVEVCCYAGLDGTACVEYSLRNPRQSKTLGRPGQDSTQPGLSKPRTPNLQSQSAACLETARLLGCNRKHVYGVLPCSILSPEVEVRHQSGTLCMGADGPL